MYIVKPQKGFVIPVEYMVNEKLYSDGVYDFRHVESDKIIEADNSENDITFTETDELDDIVNDRLFSEDDDNYDGRNVITAILEDKENREKSGTGMLVFDDVIGNNDIEIDEIKTMELDKARLNYRKAIEVEIEKVGKLVLDDSETEINSKVSVKSADVKIDSGKADELEENIVTDEAREDDNEESEEEVPAPSDNNSENETVENSSDNK
ncbi:MAG: hypothetical protein Q4F66_02900 [Clostridium sp.]|nr:hypothetical protein [Clostridium sp.]